MKTLVPQQPRLPWGWIALAVAAAFLAGLCAGDAKAQDNDSCTSGGTGPGSWSIGSCKNLGRPPAVKGSGGSSTALSRAVQAKADQMAADPPNWHLLTISHGGTVSVVKGLTKDECEKSSRITIAATFVPGGRMIEASDIMRAECFE